MPGRASTARWSGFGSRDGEVYECRNQWWNPLKSIGPARTWWIWAGIAARRSLLHPEVTVSTSSTSGATTKCCGVVVARPAGEKLGADPVERSVVNVGTVSGPPSLRAASPAAARHVVC